MRNPGRLRLTVLCGLLTLCTAGLVACSKPSGRTDSVDYWTCGMHPSVHAAAPGKCPICGMDLVPVIHPTQNKAESGSIVQQSEGQATSGESASKNGLAVEGENSGALHEFTVPARRQQQIGVTYTEAKLRRMLLSVRSVGILEVDQSQAVECVAHVDGYIESLQVTSPGERVVVGQPLMTIYSPDIRSPEQELINLLKVKTSSTADPASMDLLIDAARRRLELLGVDPREISQLERTGQPTDRLVFRSTFDGVVSEAPLKVGVSVKKGDKVMGLVNLSRLWLRASFYENDIGLLREGTAVKVTLPAFADRCFEGKIGVISPTIDPTSHTGLARIDIPNAAGQLRPGMYADVVVNIDGGEGVGVPFDSVLPTGSRMLVFVDRESGRLEPRFIQVGRQFYDPSDPDHQRYYQVIVGLEVGDRIVSRANFLIDAEAQIQGAIKDFEEGHEAGKTDVNRSMTQGL